MYSSDLELLARKIRNYYIVERRLYETYSTGIESTFGDNPRHLCRWDGSGPDSRGFRYGNIWLKIAKFVKERNINFERLIKSVFLYWPTRQEFLNLAVPLPTVLTSDYAISCLNKYNELSPNNEYLKISFNYECRSLYRKFLEHKLSSKNPDNIIWKHVILSSSCSPLVKYFFSKYSGNLDLIPHFIAEAKNQYLQNSSCYDEIFGRSLAEDFCEPVSVSR